MKNRLLLGIPVAVSNAYFNESARLLDCARRLSTADVFVVKFDKGPFKRSYADSIPARYRIVVSNKLTSVVVVVKSMVGI